MISASANGGFKFPAMQVNNKASFFIVLKEQKNNKKNSCFQYPISLRFYLQPP